MQFFEKDGALLGKQDYETLLIQPWGPNALRVRSTVLPHFSQENNALEPCQDCAGQITISQQEAVITNGDIKCVLLANGTLAFYRGAQLILREYYRDWRAPKNKTQALRTVARNYKTTGSEDLRITLRFDANEGEKIYGMGQYQQPNLDLKGCILELAQRNTQVSVPFYISNQNYGFLWNHPGVGEVVFGSNYTQWQGEQAQQIDYWITVADDPKGLLRNYTEVTGRAPMFPENALGLWQCKLRYRTQEEVLEVAREYKRRNIPLDVIIIDFFHWDYHGDWAFDPDYWPDPKAMTRELREMGVRCMVSVWPTVERRSVNFSQMAQRGLLVRSERGPATYPDDLGNVAFLDAFNPETRTFVWDTLKKNYLDNGVELFWLDEAEPEYGVYEFDNYRYYAGPALKVSNAYPRHYTQMIYEGMKAAGREDVVSLVRCAWAGSQKYGALVWSGDIRSTFHTLREQVVAGLNIGLAGIPWWNTDTGGFGSDVTAPGFKELLIRWFQFSVFSPVLRMHGHRRPDDIPPLSHLDHGGGHMVTGRPNELWSYGEEVYQILKKYLDIRLSMKNYLRSLMEQASQNGSPLIRTMFYEFPEDEICWELDDQYMFGDRYLVAPILYEGMRQRRVYLPNGRWRCIHSGSVLEGGTYIQAEAPLDIIPVYEKIE